MQQSFAQSPNRGFIVDSNPQFLPNSGQTARQLMRKHISDINDVITEEEFKNLVVSSTTDSDTAHEPLEIKNSDERPKDEEKDKDEKTITPWDIIE